MIELYLLSEGSTGFINSRLCYHLADFLLKDNKKAFTLGLNVPKVTAYN